MGLKSFVGWAEDSDLRWRGLVFFQSAAMVEDLHFRVLAAGYPHDEQVCF